MDGLGVTRRGLLKVGGAAAFAAAAGGGAVSVLRGGSQDETPPAGFYLGTYAPAGGAGIARGRLDPAAGTPLVEDYTGEVSAASWLATSPAGSILYAISEQDAGTVSTLTPDLKVLRTTPTGAGPVHVAVHPGGTYLFVSLYGGGAVVTHPIADDGTVDPATDTHKHRSGNRTPHAHQVVVDPMGAHVLAVDLGLDLVFTYALEGESGKLSEVDRTKLARGSGPRHLAFHPDGTFAYVANENDSTVTVCSWADGVLEPGQVIDAAPKTGVPNQPGEIAVSADGRFVYVSNRGSNTIGVFVVSNNGAALNRIADPTCGGDWPRHLALDRTGKRLYVANQRSGTITWLPIDLTTGLPGAVAGTLAAPEAAQILV